MMGLHEQQLHQWSSIAMVQHHTMIQYHLPSSPTMNPHERQLNPASQWSSTTDIGSGSDPSQQ